MMGLFKCRIILVLILALKLNAGPLKDFERSILSLYASKDACTRLTSYLLTAEIHSDSLRNYLRVQLKSKGGLDGTAILYVLNTPSGSESDRRAFVNSIKKDSLFIKNLIAADIGETTLIKGAPYLHMIDMLGQIAISDNEALDRLQFLYRFTDGWIAESVFSMIEEARSQRLKSDLQKFRMEKGL